MDVGVSDGPGWAVEVNLGDEVGVLVGLLGVPLQPAFNIITSKKAEAVSALI